MHLCIISINKQLDAQFLIYIYIFVYLSRFSTCFEQPCAHHQESQFYQYNVWYMSFCVDDRFVCRLGRNFPIGDRPVCRVGSSFPTCIPDGHRHRVTLHQTLYWHNWLSWWWTQGCSKHVENLYIYIYTYKRNCASSWLFIGKFTFTRSAFLFSPKI